MKKLKHLAAFLIAALMSVCIIAGICACGKKEPPAETLYKVSYVAGGGTGTAPAVKSYAEGTEITLEQNPFTYTGHVFAGWSADGQIYQGGGAYTVPAHDTVFTATWNIQTPEHEPQPSFSKAGYEYDRIGGNDLELPFDLDGANFMSLELDGDAVPPAMVSYNTAKASIVVKSEYILTLEEGQYTLTAITDALEGETTCTLTIKQSLKTTFDETTTKAFSYGTDEGVTFTVGYNTTTPVRLTQGDIEIDSKYWTYDSNSFTVKGEWLAKNCEATDYRVYLSNNDSYTFTVTNNVLFASDYDVSTIHNETASNEGHNPLYQYYSSVSIAETPAAMNTGKALKLTPLAEQETSFVEPLWAYLTITQTGDNKEWYKIAIDPDKQYVVTFDYFTENSAATEGNSLVFKCGATLSEELLLGTENDGVLHHYVATFSGSSFGSGMCLHAKVVGGTVWVDNIKIVELDALPALTVNGEYKGTGDYTALTLNAAGFSYTILIDGEEVESSLEGSALTIPAAELSEISIGQHTISVQTVFGVLVSKKFSVTDNRISELNVTSKEYRAASGEDVIFEGSFAEGLEIDSLHLVDRVYDNGYRDWDFLHYNTEKDYKEYATLKCGLEGAGTLTISKTLLANFCGQTDFVIEFSNGKTQNFTINITDVVFASNYDDLTIRGYLGGSANDGIVLHSGMRGDGVAVGVEDRDDEGGKAFFVRSSKEALDARVFTFRYSRSNPVYEWYHIESELGTLYRITFDYKITSAFEGAYFDIGYTDTTNVFGNYTSAAPNSIQFALQADGQLHTFDSGWFVHTDGICTSVFLPKIAAADGQYAMFDNFRAVKKMATATVGATLTYDLSTPTEMKIALNGKSVKSVELDDKAFGYDSADDAITLKQSELNELEAGKHTVLVETDSGYIVCSINIRSGDAKLTETSKTVKYGELGDIKLSGTFKDGLKITEIRRSGEYTGYDTNPIMDISYITVATDGLTISRKLVDQVYKTCTYTVTFDNEEQVTFTLTSDLVWFTNYDETCLYEHGVGNVPLCQDTAMIKLAKDAEGGGSHLEYRPGDATLGHSSNPAGAGNFALTFNTVYKGDRNWFQLNTEATGKLKVFFKYKITGNDKPGRFIFVLCDEKGEIQLSTSYDEHGNAEGTFSHEFDLNGVSGIGVRFKADSLEECQGCVLELDDFGIAYSAE